MRYSKLFGKTLRDKPRNADSESHQLLLRAGFVRPAAGGGFFLMPLGQRVMARIESLVEKELKSSGAALLGLPSGKLAANSDLGRSLRMRRREAADDYPFADHHESTLAMFSGNLALSYRDLPLAVAGMRWSSRDEAHPNWGLLAAPECPFHAAYVFGGPSEPVAAAYRRALEVMGVQAFAMAPAAAASTEFAIETTLAARPILACDHCGYRAPVEIAVSRVPDWPQNREPGVSEAVYGPGLIQVQPLAQFLGIPVHQTTKTMLFEVRGRVVAACVAGIYGVSEAKLMRVLGCRSLALAPPEVVRELTHSEIGYAGPAGLPEAVEVIWDLSTEHRSNFEAGANQTDHHRINLNFGRDIPRPEKFFDIRTSLAGDSCAQCDGGTLAGRGAIVLGHALDLGDLYAELLGAKFLDADKTTRPLPAACAGLDLAAAMAAVVEQHHDGRGIVWPEAVAPFTAHLVSLPPAETAAEGLYQELVAAGVDVLWDDRSESAGVKFGDADLIGIPVRLVMSKRTGEKVEWKPRAAENGELLDVEEVIKRL